MHSAPAPALPEGRIARIARIVQEPLRQVETRIAEQAAAFDPAVEGYVSYALGSRGKRLRPLVALLTGGALGPITPKHVDLAVVVELIHMATLVHDDIMDEAERRRAQPTVNARWGNSLSVLLGDSMFAHALELSTNFDNAEISRAIARAARDVCTGEMIQTQRQFDLHLRIEDYQRIIELKTGSLFAAASELAALISGANAETTAALKVFGTRIGTAYQIYDDCVDVAGDESETGKTLGTDIRKGKLTLPILMLLNHAPPALKERCSELILDGASGEIARLLKTAVADNALSTSIDTGQKMLRQAQDELKILPVNQFSDALAQLSEGVSELLEQLRA